MYFKANLTAYNTIVIKEILRFSRIWLQTIVPPAITTTLYFIIFGRLIGSQLGDIDNYSYMDYIVPGLIIMSIITNSYANVVSSFYGTKFHHHIEELLVSPVSNLTIIAGYVSGGVARGMVVGLVVTLVSPVFYYYYGGQLCDYHSHCHLNGGAVLPGRADKRHLCK